MKPVFTFLLLLPLLFQCNRTTYTSATFPTDYLVFGEGGGFSGSATTYFVLPNGQIFHSKGFNTDTLAFAQISKKSATKLIERFNSLGLDTLDFDHPGNTYQFVGRHSTDKVSRLSMGANQATPPPALSSFYQELSEILKEVTPKTEDQ